jgi:hypothetical protein
LASWAEFEAADPELAAFGRALLYKTGDPIGYLATVRAADGGPRVHPVCPIPAAGRLYVTIPRISPKVRDLEADARFMFHTYPGDRDPEFSFRGRARLVTDDEERGVVNEACTFATGVRDEDEVFELDIERADSTTWANWAQADTYAIRKKWIVS